MDTYAFRHPRGSGYLNREGGEPCCLCCETLVSYSADDYEHPELIDDDDKLSRPPCNETARYVYAQDEANARLIAAAPEMLALLRGLLDEAKNQNRGMVSDAGLRAMILLARIDGGV